MTTERVETLKVWRCVCGHVKDAHDAETGWCMTVVGVTRQDVKGLQSPMPVHCPCEKLEAEEVEVVPANSPNVLSVEEARLVARSLPFDNDERELDLSMALYKRLSGWAAENPKTPSQVDSIVVDMVDGLEQSIASENPETTEEGK